MSSREGVFVHPTAEVADSATVGRGSYVWHHAHVMEGAVLGEGCVLGHASFVGANVRIGSGCRIQNHVSIFEGVTLEADVFVGPSVSFTNVRAPRAAFSRNGNYESTRVLRGASIGANATILPGVVLGEWCLVGAGAVVTRDVGSYELVVGAPARRVGFVSRRGERLHFGNDGLASCSVTGEQYRSLGGDRVEKVDA